MSLLSALHFEEVVDIMQIYLNNQKCENVQLIELLKFDLLRKCEASTSL